MTGSPQSSPRSLGRFPLFATASQAEAEARLNQCLPGRRSFVSAAPGAATYAVNHLRLRACSMACVSMTPSLVRGENDGMATIYLPRRGGLELRYAGRTRTFEPGTLACLMPAGDRLVRYEGLHESLLVRIAPDVLHDCMEAHGHAPGGDWSCIFAGVSMKVPQAAALATLMADIAETYDDPDGSPSWQLDSLFGRSIALAVADLLVVVSGRTPSSVPSYVVAQRAEDYLIGHFRGDPGLLDMSRAIGATIPQIRRSMLCYRGIGPEDFLLFVRAVAAQDLARTGLDSREAARAAGFPTLAAFRRAERRVGELRRSLGRPFAARGAARNAAA